MKISQIRGAYEDSTGKVSDIVRQLNFAGIAIIWVLRVGKESGGLEYSPILKWPLALFVASLTLDLLQYMYKSIVWGLLNTYYFRKLGDEEKDVEVSGMWNYVALVFFWLKTAVTISAYVCLLVFIYRQL